jgi:hypothetical protein
MVNIALYSCSSIGVAVGQVAVLPTGDRVASSSLQETVDNKRYCLQLHIGSSANHCVLSGNMYGRSQLEDLHVAKRDIIKMAIKEIGWESVKWIHLVRM